MFYTEYAPLSEAEIAEKIERQRAPSGGGCAALAGKSFQVRLEGQFAPQQLDYAVEDEKTLRFTENGESYTAPYSAVSMGKLTLFSHLVPGTTRGWHLILDRETCALTAFETWFGVKVPTGIDFTGKKPPAGWREIPREVQRQYYFGWADFGGGEKPEELHATTNHIEGRGMHWKFSTGYEQLTFFPSLVFSAFVELGDERGGITMANPSDYVKLDDARYLYTRSEVEYSGKFWIEVMDFFESRAIGLEFGVGDGDEFVYDLHTAQFEITGDAAHMESIGVNGDKEPPMALSRVKGFKGGRSAYRPRDIDPPMSREEALRHAAEAQRIFDFNAQSIMGSKHNLPVCGFLAGKQFKVRPDCEKHVSAPWTGDGSLVYDYDVIDERRLRWRVNDGAWQEEQYVCFEPAKGLYFFSHLLTGDPDFASVAHAVDFTDGLATTVRAKIGNWRSEWEVGSQVRFGTLEYGGLKPPFARRHHFTTELVGRSYAWNYSEMMNSIHVYSAPESYAWVILQPDNSGGAMWSSPCWYVKLRDDAYLFQWVEEKCNGSQGLVVINPKILHDGGFFFGVSHSGLKLSITGAYGRELGRYDILKYFGRK